MALDFFENLRIPGGVVEDLPPDEEEPRRSISRTVREADVGERGQLTGATAKDLLSAGETQEKGFFSKLRGEDPGTIAETASRGATAGLARMALFAPGAIGGGKLGATGFAAGPVVGTLTTVAGVLIGGMTTLLAGEYALNEIAGEQVIPRMEDEPPALRPVFAGAETAASFVVPTGGFMVAARLGMQLKPSLVGNFVNRALDVARRKPGQFAATEAVVIPGVALAGAVSEEVFPGKILPRLGLEVGAAVFNPTRLLLGVSDRIINSVRRVAGGLTLTGKQTKAAQLVQELVKRTGEDRQALAALLRRKDLFPELNTTAAQRIRSQTFSRFEAEFARIEESFGVEMRKSAEEAVELLASEMILLRGTGDAVAIREAAKDMKTTIRTFLTMRAMAMEKKAAEAAREITSDAPEAKAKLSKVLEKVVDDSLLSAREAERAAWSAVPDVVTDANNLFSQVSKTLGQFLPRKIEALKKLAPTAMETIGDLQVAQRVLARAAEGKKVSPGELAAAEKMFTTDRMSKLRSELLDSIRKLNAVTHPNERRIFGEWAEAILRDLNEGIDVAKIPQEAKEALDFARAYSFQLNETFSRSLAGAARATTRTGAQRIPPELLAREALATGEEVAALRMGELEAAARFLPLKAEELARRGVEVGVEQAQRDFELMMDAQHRLLKLAAAKSTDPITGRVTPGRLASFIRDHAELLERFPDYIKETLETAIKSEEGLRAMEKLTKRRLGQLDKSKSSFNRVLGVDSLSDAVKGALSDSNPTPLRAMTRMARLARKGGDAAVADLRGGIWDYAISLATNDAGDVSLKLLANALVQPMRPGLPSLIQFMSRQKIMGLKEIARVRQFVNRSRIIGEALETQAVGELVLGGGALDVPDAAINTLLSIAGARSGALVSKQVGEITGAGGSGASLIAAGRGAEFFRQVFGRLPKIKVQEVLHNAFRGDPLTPEGPRYGLLIALLEQTVTPELMIGKAQQIHAYLVASGLVALTSDDDSLVSSLVRPEEEKEEVVAAPEEDEAADEADEKALMALPPPEEEEEVVEGEEEVQVTQPSLRQAEETQELPPPGEEELEIEAKEGVDLTTLKPEARSAAATAQTVFAEFGLTAVVTSTGPGDRENTKSVEGTKHDLGQAFDLRIRSIPKKMLKEVVAALKLALGDDYDVVLERDHIHVEFDPKKLR